ncbi:MAG: NADP-dependent malic enzyme [Candidatus Thermoplasmatota archaeon]|nr:NADP-dependent malic enzyme [Candidatus Thermoplasmatota archaeon]
MKKPTVKELLAKAEKPNKDAMKLHPFYHGKIEVVPKCVIRNFEDFGIWYTPGVAQPCRAIKENKNLVYDMTNKWNNVAVVSDGTRVLGLGDIGPEAGLPVMEGKALLFKYLGGVDAFPICLKTKDADEIIKTVKILQPSFGGINLEDISQPKCFRILETLRKECEIPVWHDDQQGTAAIILAGLINALKFVDKKMNEVKITMIGAGAANICAARMMIVAGVKPGNLIMVDSKGVLNQQRTELKENYKEKWEMCLKTNSEQKSGDAADAMKNADVCIAASKPGPGTIKPEWVKDMADDSIVFACANPVPEIWPWEAKEAGAKVFATGRSDFPNQVNNSLGFPGIFRGTLDVRAETITDEMCVEAAKALAECAEEKGLREDYIIPDMDDWEVFPKEATAVAMKAIEQGVARKKLGRNEEYENAKNIIKRARDTADMLMEKGFIKPAPE